MTETIAPPAGGPAAPQGVLARAFGVVTAPRATYAAVASRPRWLGILLIVVLVSGVASSVFLSTEVGQRALVDQYISQTEAAGRHLTDAQVQQFERVAAYFKYFAMGLQVLTFGAGGVLIAGLAFGVFSAILGGDATFNQVFAIVAHSGVILALQALFTFPIAYARETLANPTSIAVFLPMLEDNTFLGRLIGSVDLFRLWWTVSLAIGFGVLYKRKTGPIAVVLLAIYAAIALVYATVVTLGAGA